MKGLYSNRTDYPVKLITSLLMACVLAMALGSCAMLESKSDTPQPVEPVVPEPDLPCSTLTAKELEREALELLDAGKDPEAREKLQCALELSPGSNMAVILLEQLDADPKKYLGNRYFWYNVKSNETLSRIAQEYLGSSLKFVILAKYNDIEVPANLYTNQKIKIPGKKPVRDEIAPKTEAAKEPATSTAEQLRNESLRNEQQNRLEKAFELMTQAVAEDSTLENAQEDLARIRKGLIMQLEEEAYNQEMSDNPDKAIEIWRKILSLDPNNIPAQLALKRLTE
jgi:tetratricopeptide (TPR) repeat protein